MRTIILGLFLLSVASLTGQENPTSPTTTNETPKRTTEVPPLPGDGPFAFFKVFSGNPGKAALYSAIIPGAGQLYNKNYWKVPVVLAAEGTALFLVFNNHSNFRAWRQAHIDFAAEDITFFRGATTTSQARLVRDRFEQNRDFAIIGTVAVHLIQIADAFIHRHLVEFDISEDLSINAFSTGQGFSLVMTF